MSNDSPRNDPQSHPDDGLETGLKQYFHARREQTRIPDFDRTLLRVDAEIRRRAAPGMRPGLSPGGFSGVSRLLRRWLNGPGMLAGVAVLCFVVLAGLLVRPEVATPAADPVLLAQLEQTTLWVAPSDRWLKPVSSPLLLGIPDFSAMQFHMTEALTWPDLDG